MTPASPRLAECHQEFKLMNRISQTIFLFVIFCTMTTHAQLGASVSPPKTTVPETAAPLAVKSYSTNAVNVSSQPMPAIIPASQPALSAQTFVPAPVMVKPKAVQAPDTQIPSAVVDNSQSVNLTNNGLAVAVSVPKIVGQKAIVQLKFQNNLADKVESARAVCFLLDEQGKIVGQSTKWIIGQNKVGLEPKGKATFNFVIASPQPFTATNLTAKVSFGRVILAGERLVDPQKTVQIQNIQ